MSSQRYVSTSFWDDAWVQELDPSEKLFYIYLLTCPLTNIAGIYKITDRRVSFDTGMSPEVVREMWRRFTESGKAVRLNEWVIIPNWPKHQKWDAKHTVRVGIERCLKETPAEVLSMAVQVGYAYPIDTVPIGPDMVRIEPDTVPIEPDTVHIEPDTAPATLNSDLDLDLDLDSREESIEPAEPSPMKDPLADQLQNAFVSKVPMQVWANIGKERATLNTLAKKIRAISEDESAMAGTILERFWEMRNASTKEFWRGVPFTPGGLMSRWDQVIADLQRRSDEANSAKQTEEWLNGE